MLQLWQNFDRGILNGIAAFVREGASWSVYVEEEKQQRIPDLGEWKGDGLIVNFDDREVALGLGRVRRPIVGLGGGGGWYDPRSGIPYVATDNEAIGRLAAEHLLERGLQHFAFCGYPPTRTNVWLGGRIRGFRDRLAREGFSCRIFLGRHRTAHRWTQVQRELQAWLASLPKPVGVMGCYDWRARHVLQACATMGLRVPDEVAVIGVDNDTVCDLAAPPLTSVEQGRFQIGYQAASLLDQMMRGRRPARAHVSVPPVGVVSRQSTDLIYVADRAVAEALRIIRERACQGLNAIAVAEAVRLSRSALDRRFRGRIGRAVDREIRRVRLARAQEMLARTSLPLRIVARETGHCSEQYLSAVFRAACHCTPTQYRLMRRRDVAHIT